MRVDDNHGRIGGKFTKINSYQIFARMVHGTHRFELDQRLGTEVDLSIEPTWRNEYQRLLHALHKTPLKPLLLVQSQLASAMNR